MSLVINTNINSLNTQNNLAKSQNALSQATQRLSSGLKINSAADNAAGFAISQRYTTQIGGLAQASANASDAINLAQTAGSALDQVTANLQAIRDLAAQSANGTYSADDRKTIDAEVQQRLSEVTRIANQTTFNGKKVLDGSLVSQSFQIGANVGQTVSVSLGTSVQAAKMGSIAEVSTKDISAMFSGSATGTGAAGSFDFTVATGTPATFTVDGKSVALTTNVTNEAGLQAAVQTALGTGTYAVSVDATTGGLKIVNTTAGSAAPVIGGVSGDITAVFGGTPTASTGVTMAAEGLSINTTAIDLTGVTNMQQLSDAINAKGVDGVSTAVSADGKGINFYSSTTLNIADTKGNIIGGNATDANANATYVVGTAATVGGSLASGNVKSVDAANDLMSRIDVALTSVADFAANLGAVQNRFQSTISTLSAQTTNLKSSQSTIQDADFAAETANLSKASVLQQAGISVLAQANASPQQVLKLLQ
ncbi:MAG: flagellin [Rhodanobacter sp.]